METVSSENITNEFLAFNQSQWTSNGSNIYLMSSVGIGTSLPRATLDVYGTINAFAINANIVLGNIISEVNIYSVNSVSASNLFGNLYGSNLVAALNIYASNAVSASNLFGNLYGSNLVAALNIYASNAVSASNLFGNIVGSNIVSASNVYGNLYGSNLVSALNVYASNGVVASNLFGNIVGSNLVSALNVYASNAIVASNIFGNVVGSNTISSSNVLIASGLPSSVVLGSNVFVFSNAYGFSNVILMNSTGQIGIGTTSATTTLQVNGQISSFGKSGFGVCAPLVARQGVSGGSNWNPSGGAQANFNITSGAVQMQAGSNTMPASPTTITFPVAYTNNPIVLVTAYSTTASSNPWVSAITASNFAVTWTNFGTFEWIAIGI